MAGDPYCWGDNYHGRLGGGDVVYSHLPLRVPGVPALVQLSASAYDGTCGLDSAGALYCWGGNVDPGQYGAGTSAGGFNVAQQRVAWESPMSQISLGAYSTCGVAMNSEVWCTGANWSGELGSGRDSGRNSWASRAMRVVAPRP
jgi:alpha-tubulin suppressor-like RCC1 family protein